MNRGLITILLVGVVLPVILFLTLPSWLASMTPNKFPADYTDLVIKILFIAPLGSLVLLAYNYYKKINSIGWYVLGTILFMGSSFIAYSIYSLSNFGF